MRMRRRRAERCLQHAQVALEAGLIAESIEAFEEARQLNPSGAGVQEFAERLSALTSPPADTSPRSRSRSATIAIVLFALIALSGLLGWLIVHRSMGVQEAPPLRADIRLENEAPVNRVPISPDNTVGSPIDTTAGPPIATAGSPIADAPAMVHEPPAPASRETPFPTQAPVAQVAIRPSSTTDAASIGTVQPETVTRKTDPAPQPRENDPRTPDPIPATDLVLPSSSTVPIAPAAPPPAVDGRPTAPAIAAAGSMPDQRAAIRAALGRYEAAYSDLDVAAVQRVWPALDRRALTRAFDNLASQHVSLQNCNVDVDGGTARASCSGTAAWTPKVGGGLRTTARKWVFDLSQSEGGWHIVGVQAR
jgi:hypothetical protein